MAICKTGSCKRTVVGSLDKGGLTNGYTTTSGEWGVGSSRSGS